MVSFFNIKNFKSRKALMESFLNFRSFKSREKVTESFFSDHASSSFYMMHTFPGTIFSLSVPTESLWLYHSFFDYIPLTIYFNLHEERCRAYFSKYCKSYFPTTPINGFTYKMSEVAVLNFPSYSCSQHFQKYRQRVLVLEMTCCGNFTFNWIFCVCSFS